MKSSSARVTSTALTRVFARGETRAILKQIQDLERGVIRLSHPSCSARDLQMLAHALEKIPSLKATISFNGKGEVESCLDTLVDLSSLVSQTQRALVEHPPLKRGGSRPPDPRKS